MAPWLRSGRGARPRAEAPRRLVPADDGALRRNNLNSLRLIMALLVVWSHSFAIWYGSEDGEWLSRLTAGTYNSGNLGVLAFFAISGFLIPLSFLRSASWRSFLRKRVARIYPGYLVAITLCSLVVVPLFSSRRFGDLDGRELGRLASNLLLRGYIIPSDAFGGGAVDGSLWSIPFEFWCYLGVLALGVAGLLSRRWAFPLGAAAVMLTRTWLDLTGRHPGGGWAEWLIGYPYFWFEVLPPFLLGTAVLCFRAELPRSRTLLAALLLAALGAAHAPVADAWRVAAARLLVPPALVYALFYVAFHPRLRLGDAARRGDISYGCYLYAFPIQQMLLAVGGRGMTFPGYVALGMLLSLLAGAASWMAVERWFEGGRLYRRRARPLDLEAKLAAP